MICSCMRLNHFKKNFIALVILIGILGVLFWSWGAYAVMFVAIGFLIGTAFMLYLGRG